MRLFFNLISLSCDLKLNAKLYCLHFVGFSSSDDSSSPVWIILFPVVAGGILLTLITLVPLRKMIKKRQEWKLQGLTLYPQ